MQASGTMSPKMQLLRERGAIHGSISHVSLSTFEDSISIFFSFPLLYFSIYLILLQLTQKVGIRKCHVEAILASCPICFPFIYRGVIMAGLQDWTHCLIKLRNQNDCFCCIKMATVQTEPFVFQKKNDPMHLLFTL